MLAWLRNETCRRQLQCSPVWIAARRSSISLSLPLSCFCSSKRTPSIYTPHFFQMFKILMQTWKSKLLNALWHVLLTLCFIADVSEPQSSEISCLQLSKIFKEWNENHFDFQSFIQPASLLLTRPHVPWARICDASYRGKHRIQSIGKIHPLSYLPSFQV